MMDALFNLAKAVAAMVAVMVIWFAIQAFIRRKSGCGSEPGRFGFYETRLRRM